MSKDTKWASYYDMKEVSDKTIDDTLAQCYRYVHDACNLEFEFSSSTSGMYSKWVMGISPMCTVRDIRVRPPKASGNCMEEAWKSLGIEMRKFCDAQGYEPARENVEVPLGTLPDTLALDDRGVSL